MTWADALRENGEQEGYPACCIEEFVEDVTVLGGYPAIQRPVYGLDYVPCSACALRLLAGVTFPVHDRRSVGVLVDGTMVWLDELLARPEQGRT